MHGLATEAVGETAHGNRQLVVVGVSLWAGSGAWGFGIGHGTFLSNTNASAALRLCANPKSRMSNPGSITTPSS